MPVPYGSAAGAMSKRQQQPPPPPPPAENKGGQQTLIIVAVVVLSLLVVAITLHLIWKKVFLARRKKNGSASSTTSGRTGIFGWRSESRGTYSSQLQGDELSATGAQSRASPEREMESETSGNANNTTSRSNSTANNVNRNTSVRSIMTLPAYSPSAGEDERILGREGERAGIDTVLEFPETHDEEESRRDQEMESLYQIRVARRAEASDREERRRQRREARQRGDYDTLAAIRRRAELATEQSVSSALIAEHQTADRTRRVSSVQYAELGVAHHDGSRIRANSSESARPLLDSAASISSNPRGSIGTLSTHHRGRSASSVLSISDAGSDDFHNITTRRVSGGSMNTDFEEVSLNNPRSRSPSVNIQTSGDMGEQPIPHVDPPLYDDLAMEDAPPYSSPVQTRAPTFPNNSNMARNISQSSTNNATVSPIVANGPRLPTIERLPSIRITETISPIDGAPPVRFNSQNNRS